jgi:AraC-like DNA-binding protein
MDALSETLRVVRLVGAVFINARFTAPWCYQSPRADAAAPLLEPGAERIVIWHLVTEGECFVEMPDGATVRLVAGDAVLFPQGDAHRMTSTPGLAPAGGADLATVLARRPRQLCHGGGGATTRLICGYLACDRRLARMLLAGLPPLLRVNVRGSNAGTWLEASVRYALSEARSPRPGGAGVLAKLAEVLFIEVLRLYMNQQDVGRTGWLAGVGDPVVGAALAALHANPAHPWSLEELGREAGSSRSVLAERFQHLVGSSPIQYLTQWRMLLAANLLTRSNASLSRIAQDVGYQTDTAFSRAFRREYGVPPATWRRRQAAPFLDLEQADLRLTPRSRAPRAGSSPTFSRSS